MGQRLKNLTFSEIGIEVGETLHLVNDSNKSCIVHNNKNEVIYNGQIYSMSKAAQIALACDYPLSGSLFWAYKGSRLSDIRARQPSSFEKFFITEDNKPVNEVENSLIRNSAKCILDRILKPKVEEALSGNKKMDSLFFILSDIEAISTQSLVIKMGNAFESFWNEFILYYVNDTDTVFDEGKFRLKDGKKIQIDTCFIRYNVNAVYYREIKCNLSLDSEKLPASIEKIKKVEEFLYQHFPGYEINTGFFNPLENIEVNSKDLSRISNYNSKAYSVKEMIELLNSEEHFTSDEYFLYFKEFIRPLIRTKHFQGL